MRFSKYLYQVLFLVTVLSFQNCSGIFQTLEDSGSSLTDSTQSDSSTPPPGTGLITEQTFKISTTELKPTALSVDGSSAPQFSQALPEGAIYDALSKKVIWIPKKGQAGTYQVSFLIDNKKINYSVSVAAVTDDRLIQQGPPFKYADGDVGYIFVHGMGDVDRCANASELAQYWGMAPAVIAPDANTRKVACYDSRRAVADVAPGVAQQIINANCGKFNKCIVVIHSMGGLLMEHMFLHTRVPTAQDPRPEFFANRELYNAAKKKVLFVVALASAAGGSKTADIVQGENLSLGQELAGYISRLMSQDGDNTKNLMVKTASNIVAPISGDPGIPFFMIPGYTEKTMTEATGFYFKFIDFFFDIPLSVFNGYRDLVVVDGISAFHSRSDGVVDLRSSCGIASDNPDDGPGKDANLEASLQYCFNARKKPNHYVWFMSNLNHYLIKDTVVGCDNSEAPCVTRLPNSQVGSFQIDPSLTGLSAVEVVRLLLGTPAQSIDYNLAQIQN